MNYSIDYLLEEVSPKLMFKSEIDKNSALNIASKALLFRSFKDLKYTYSINRNRRIFDNDSLRKYPKRDISNDGFFFSEYILSKELNINISEAIDIKNQIDYNFYNQKDFRDYDGNIGLSCSSTIEKGIGNITSEGSQMRLMAHWPLQFYFKNNSDIPVSNSQIKNKTKVDALVFDSISFVEPAYYTSSTEMSNLLETMINKALINYNILILDTAITYLMEEHSWIINLIFEKYDIVKFRLPKTIFYEYGIFIAGSKEDTSVDSGIIKVLDTTGKPLTIGSNIKENRIRLGKTQEELAFKLEVEPRSISNWENSHCRPSLINRRKLSNLFGFDFVNLD